jgi:glutaredoxin
MPNMSLTLYQFAISHYCEKIRWALDFKGLEYRTRTLLPGTHVATMKKLSGDSAVPVLVHDGTVVANSGAIRYGLARSSARGTGAVECTVGGTTRLGGGDVLSLPLTRSAACNARRLQLM